MGQEFLRQSSDLKKFVAAINAEVDSGALAEEASKDQYRQWIQLCSDFAFRWGGDKVPMDIRQAINETRIYLGMQPVEFGDDTGVFPVDGHN